MKPGFASHPVEDAFALPPTTLVKDKGPKPYHGMTPPPKPTPYRVGVLNEAAKLTNGDRDVEYGPPTVNMACAGEFKATFRKWLARDISAAEQEAIDMVLTKISRLACGNPKRDTYVDGASYMGIAAECAFKQ